MGVLEKETKFKKETKIKKKTKIKKETNTKKETKIKKETKKKTHILGTEENKSCNLSGQKKSLNISVPKKSRNLSGQKKITQPIGTTKNHATSWGKKCPKNSNLSHNQTSGDRHRSPWSYLHNIYTFCII